MIIELDMQSDVPIYTQLVNQIIEGIASGRLKLGEPLPSVRSLASDIGINLHTVNKAYTLLKQDGYIQVHRQRGVVVDPDGMPAVTEEFMAKQRSQLKPIVAEAICRGMDKQQLMDLVERIHQEITETDNEKENA
ncbi:GntR family transcriptional regulator [Paenibacillus woosongensis]|uniref:GntR family transcriptional regulator n=1 Tax=Paenibacillus woosongensis TaxID=307580 RepID=A0A7X2Z309_9BACL|nr:GntR family transcriptional regulator [Paenibacillus woosongensis]MUG46551.1 GntR family transcriptional regulator [Paenibacillus woosongensis]